jgi:hypothetical protein
VPAFGGEYVAVAQLADMALDIAIGVGLGISFASYDFSKVIAQNKYGYFRNCAAGQETLAKAFTETW